MIKSSGGFCITPVTTTIKVSIITTTVDNFFIPGNHYFLLIFGTFYSFNWCLGTYEDSCSLEKSCDSTQGLQCINNTCKCSQKLY